MKIIRVPTRGTNAHEPTNARSVTINPQNCKWWVHIYPQTDLFTAISERLGVKRNALVFLLKIDVWAMKWHHSGKSTIIHNSKMVASKPKIRIYYTILDISRCVIAFLLASDKIPTATHSGSQAIRRTNRKWKIQDGGHRTESISTSASTGLRDSNEISMFRGSSNPPMLKKSPCEQTGSAK